MEEKNNTLIISIVGAVAVFICGFYIGNNNGQNKIFNEAVKRDVGEWVIQADGKPTFRFKK